MTETPQREWRKESYQLMADCRAPRGVGSRRAVQCREARFWNEVFAEYKRQFGHQADSAYAALDGIDPS